MSSKALAETIFEDTFQNSEYWNFISDDVMGGVSTGNVKYKTTKNETVSILSVMYQRKIMVVLFKFKEN